MAFYWKNIEGPSIDHWFKDLAHYIVLERIAYSIKGKLKDCHKIWDLFIQFLENNQILAQAQNTSNSTDWYAYICTFVCENMFIYLS